VRHLLEANTVVSLSSCVGLEIFSAASANRYLEPDGNRPQRQRFAVHSHSRELQFDIIPDALIYSVVKWFNPKRGFGFVVLSDGSGEAFVDRNALAQSEIDTAEPGAVFKVRVVREDGGLKVVEAMRVDSSTNDPTTRCRNTRLGQPAIHEGGTVKSYKANGRYGFIARDGGGRDVFFHVSSLKRRKISHLSEGQRVIMDVIEGRKGPKATNIRLVLSVSGINGERDEPVGLHWHAACSDQSRH
jgi:cold shock protein